MEITLPIYYIQKFKTKPDKNIMMGLNWYRNAHYAIKNKVKQDYHNMVSSQLSALSVPQYDKYRLLITVYPKHTNCDASNIAPMMEKFTLDALQELGITIDDTVKYHKQTTWTVTDPDKTNPRCKIEIIPID